MIYSIFSIMTLVLALILGVYVYESDKKNQVNKFFILLLFGAIFWIFSNFMTDVSIDVEDVVLWSKMTLVGPILIAYFFYKLSIFFPRKKHTVRTHEIYLLIVVAALIVLSFTKLNVAAVSLSNNHVPTIIPGHLYPFFLAYFVGLTVFALRNLFFEYKEFNKFEKLQVQYISLGLTISAIMGTMINGVLPVLGNSNYVNFGPYFILFFIFFTSYAIIKFKLFDIKIITTQLIVFSLWIFIFLRMLLANSLEDRIINGGLLLLLIVFGTFLIRSVIKEVSQREKIEKLAVDLQTANDRLTELDKQKSEFVSFATHQLRAPLTAMKGYASLILEGEMGKLSTDLRAAIGRIFDSSKTLTNIVDDYLNISRIELGTMKYLFDTIDLKDLVDSVVGELKPNIEKSKLAFSFNVDRQKKYMVRADRDKFKQILVNIIDNSMKYTPTGSVTVSVTKAAANGDAHDGKILFSVKDTGIGIAKEVMPKLFAKFSRADNGNRQNIYGTGLGLYVAKEIVTAHKGRVWAESEGEGRGSQFYVELDEVI